MTEYSIKKYTMWDKVNELFANGLNKTQISKELGIDRGTVRHYLKMNYQEFISSGSFKRNYLHKLSPYEDFIKKRLDYYNNLTASQIHDNLREKFPDMPTVHYRTVYNYVKLIRKKYNIPQSDNQTREFSKLAETDPGEYAQVDFGECWMRDRDEQRVKVYFFCLLLSYSRYKYFYIQTTPFTSASTVYAHELAFDHLQGIPKKIIYDQDKVLINSENLGDYLLTKKFRSFVNQYHFKPIFCRKADPQSKGKVENSVKYIKNNFLKGRQFTNIKELNRDVLSWMDRTANGLPHNGTRLIPYNVYQSNKETLTKYFGTPTPIQENPKEYLVRKDNTIMYKYNFYTLPAGTYKNKGTYVFVNVTGRELDIYDKETGKTITKHTVALTKGKTIINPEHRRKNKNKVDNLEKEILSILDNADIATRYLNRTNELKPRYYYDSLKIIYQIINQFSKKDIINCMSNQLIINSFNANILRSNLELNIVSTHKDTLDNQQYNSIKYTPDTRDLLTYREIL